MFEDFARIWIRITLHLVIAAQGWDVSSQVSCWTKRTNPIWFCIWFDDTKFWHFPLVASYLCIVPNQKNQPNLVLYLVRRSKIFVSVTTLLLPFSAMCVTSLMSKSVYNLGKIVSISALTFGTCRRNISWWGRFGEITMRGNYSFGIWNRTTGLSKRNGAKFRELSLNFPWLADWLCNSRPRCRAALGREFSKRGHFFRTTL